MVAYIRREHQEAEISHYFKEYQEKKVWHGQVSEPSKVGIRSSDNGIVYLLLFMVPKKTNSHTTGHEYRRE